MNIERETKMTFTLSFTDIIKLSRQAWPEEFLLNSVPLVMGKNVTMVQQGSALQITVTKASQGPAEISFNRMQRDDGAA